MIKIGKGIYRVKSTKREIEVLEFMVSIFFYKYKGCEKVHYTGVCNFDSHFERL